MFFLLEFLKQLLLWEAHTNDFALRMLHYMRVYIQKTILRMNESDKGPFNKGKHLPKTEIHLSSITPSASFLLYTYTPKNKDRTYILQFDPEGDKGSSLLHSDFILLSPRRHQRWSGIVEYYRSILLISN